MAEIMGLKTILEAFLSLVVFGFVSFLVVQELTTFGGPLLF